MRPAQVLRRASDYLARHQVESPLPTAEILLAGVVGTDRGGLYLRDRDLSSSEAKAFGRALCLRCSGTPVQHLTGEQVFRMLVIQMRPGVFIPRPESELLVGTVLGAVRGLDAPIVVDVGTGSGAIALAIADEHPGARVWATDLSPEAVALARANADRLDLAVSVLHGDLLDSLPATLRGKVDAVVCNPPYVSAGDYGALPLEVRADPRIALVGDLDGYARLAASARSWLRPGGVLAVEIGETMGSDVAELLEQAGFGAVEVRRDLTDRDRFVTGGRS